MVNIVQTSNDIWLGRLRFSAVQSVNGIYQLQYDRQKKSYNCEPNAFVELNKFIFFFLNRSSFLNKQLKK